MLWNPFSSSAPQRAIGNAINHLVTTQQLGMNPEQSAEENWQALCQV